MSQTKSSEKSKRRLAACESVPRKVRRTSQKRKTPRSSQKTTTRKSVLRDIKNETFHHNKVCLSVRQSKNASRSK